MTPAPRHYGDPAAEYRAATESAALFDRSARPLLEVVGRAPGQMLAGVVTGRIPGLGEVLEGGRRVGAAYSTLLTPKGRIVSDLTLIREPGAEEGFWMDVPAEGLEALRAHFAKVLPPRMARVAPVEGVGRFALVGPAASGALARVLALPADTRVLEEASEEEAFVFPLPVGSRSDDASKGESGTDDASDGEAGSGWVTVFRPAELGTAGWELFGPVAAIERLRARLEELEIVSAGTSVWETLRIEAGRPRFGLDMTESTIPTEAGIDERAIDFQKGCYTGQEVIVRIKHRGHVNRHLRRLHLGDAPSPAAGTELFAEGADKPVGWITSVASSPRFRETLALGYVRREVAPGDRVRIAAPEGLEAEVAELA